MTRQASSLLRNGRAPVHHLVNENLRCSDQRYHASPCRCPKAVLGIRNHLALETAVIINSSPRIIRYVAILCMLVYVISWDDFLVVFNFLRSTNMQVNDNFHWIAWVCNLHGDVSLPCWSRKVKPTFCTAGCWGTWPLLNTKCDVLGYWRRLSLCYSGLFTTSLVVTTVSFYNVL
jgi:hypothetical protein